MDALSEDIGVKNPRTVFVIEDLRRGDDGEEKALFRQYIGNLPVLNSRATVRVKGTALRQFSANFLSDDELIALPDWPSLSDLVAEYHDIKARGRVVGAGVFHGSLFGRTEWKDRQPTLVFVRIAATPRGLIREFVDWQTYEVLHEQVTTVNTDFDTYLDADCFLWAIGMDDPIKLDTVDYCAGGTYPDCTTWPQHSDTVRRDVVQLNSHYSSVFSRTSWDNMTMPSCDPNDPLVDPAKCCLTDVYPNPHAMKHASDCYGDDADEPGACLWQDTWAAPNSWWNSVICTAMFHPMYSCSDVIGHEYGHAVDYSEKQLINGYGIHQHEGAMSEAFGDVMGSSFQQIVFPGEGSAWGISDGEAYCQQVRDLQYPTGAQPRNASDFDFNYGGHTNSLAISHGFYLLGRNPAAGAVTHYGVSVTGVGIDKAQHIYFDAMTDRITDVADRTLSDLRDALLSAAGIRYGYSSTEYQQTLNTVNAMGYWTNQYSFPQSFASRPEVGLFGSVTSSSARYPTVVFVDGTAIKYRYRWFNGYYYTWTSATSLPQTTTGQMTAFTVLRAPGGFPVGFDLHVVYQDTNSYLRQFKKFSDGTTTDAPITVNGNPLRARTSKPIRVVRHGTTYRILYVPYGTDYVYMADFSVSGATAGTATSTGVFHTNEFEVASDGTAITLFYKSTGAGVLSQKKTTGTTWTSVAGGSTRADDYTIDSFDAASYLGSVHLVVRDTTDGVRYLRCSAACDAIGDWSYAGSPIDSTYDTSTQMLTLGVEFATDFGVTLGTQQATGSMMYRTKYSQ